MSPRTNLRPNEAATVPNPTDTKASPMCTTRKASVSSTAATRWITSGTQETAIHTPNPNSTSPARRGVVNRCTRHEAPIHSKAAAKTSDIPIRAHTTTEAASTLLRLTIRVIHTWAVQAATANTIQPIRRDKEDLWCSMTLSRGDCTHRAEPLVAPSGRYRQFGP